MVSVTRIRSPPSNRIWSGTLTIAVPSGGKQDLRADQRELISPEIVILRSHSASLHRTASQFALMTLIGMVTDMRRVGYCWVVCRIPVTS